MREPLPVSDEDRVSAFQTLYTTSDYSAPTLDLANYHDRHLLEQLGKVLENDRKRVIERGVTQ